MYNIFLFDIADQRGWARRWLPLLFALLVGLTFEGSRSLYGTSESRYAECGREMAESGNYLEPTLGYRYHWTKPPMTYWAVAGGLKLLGNNEWGARLYNVLAFLFTVMAVSGIGRLLYDSEIGNLSGIIYATSLFPVMAAYTVTTDMLLTMWVTFALFMYLTAWRNAQAGKASASRVVGFWCCLGLAFFTKGPPALLILLPIAIFHSKVCSRPRLFNPLGILPFLVLSLWWFITVCLLHPELWGYYLGTEIVDRVASKSVHNHAFIKSFKVYLPELTIGIGLWIILSVTVAVKFKLWKPAKVKSIVSDSLPARFLLLWLVIPLAIFMISSSKLPLYVLPIFAPLCIATAVGIVRLAPTMSFARYTTYAIMIASVIMIITFKGVIPHHVSKRNIRSVYEMCKKYEVPGTRFILVEKRSWGMLFYLKGNAIHLTSTATEDWADGLTQDALNAIAQNKTEEIPSPRRDIAQGRSATKRPERVVFIYPLWRLSDFKNKLTALKRNMEYKDNGFWGVCAITLDDNDAHEQD